MRASNRRARSRTDGAGDLAASTLYSFGPDGPPNFVPRNFTSINTAGQTSQSLFNVGNGTLGFNGGVT